MPKRLHQDLVGPLKVLRRERGRSKTLDAITDGFESIKTCFDRIDRRLEDIENKSGHKNGYKK